jgi:hypothetical protein
MQLRCWLPALVVCVALAAPATASASQTLAVDVASHPATITAPDGWTINSCYGSVTLNFGGDLSWSYFDTQPAPNEVTVGTVLSIANAGGGYSALTATCSLWRSVTSYSPITTHHTLFLDGARTTARSRKGNCGFKGFSWSGHQALQLDCWGGAAAYAKASWRINPPAGGFNPADASYGTRLCCSPGGVYRTWRQNSDGSFTYTVKVTGHRGYDIAYAAVGYDITQQVASQTHEYDTGTGEWSSSS